MPQRLTVRLRTLTPLYLGDAEQKAELRPPSIKGALRFWYRTVDLRYREPVSLPGEEGASFRKRPTREDVCFGGTAHGAGQSPFLLRVDPVPFEPYRWDRERVKRYNEGYGRATRNGLVYLGFPFHSRTNAHRTAIPPGTEFTVQCYLPRPVTDLQRHSLLGAWWLLGTLGGLGSRARRGFGSLCLLDWSVDGGGDDPDAWSRDLEALPVPGPTATYRAWLEALNQALRTLERWFHYAETARASAAPPKHPHLGPRFRAVPLPKGFPGSPSQAWEAALNHAGRQLQDFRQRREPDYSAVKAHLTGSVQLSRTPPRATFGLPLTFRYGSIRGGAVTLVPYDRERAEAGSPLERHGSLLHLKLLSMADGLHPLFVRLDGPVPGMDPPAVVRGRRFPLEPAPSNAMDTFLDQLLSRGPR